MSNKTVDAASLQPVSSQDFQIYRSTPYEYQSTTAAATVVSRVGQKTWIGTRSAGIRSNRQLALAAEFHPCLLN